MSSDVVVLSLPFLIAGVVVANPVGLGQVLLGTHIGRFSAATGVNFNRDSINVTSQVIQRLKGLLIKGDRQHNVRLIRKLMSEEIEKVEVFQQEKALKKELFRLAAVCDIVLDLHCDNSKYRAFNNCPRSTCLRSLAIFNSLLS